MGSEIRNQAGLGIGLVRGKVWVEAVFTFYSDAGRIFSCI